MKNAGIQIVFEIGGKTFTRGVHTLRHTVGTLMHEKGRSLRTIQHRLGHRSLSSTAIYTTVTPKAEAEAINGLLDDDD